MWQTFIKNVKISHFTYNSRPLYILIHTLHCSLIYSILFLHLLLDLCLQLRHIFLFLHISCFSTQYTWKQAGLNKDYYYHCFFQSIVCPLYLPIYTLQFVAVIRPIVHVNVLSIVEESDITSKPVYWNMAKPIQGIAVGFLHTGFLLIFHDSVNAQTEWFKNVIDKKFSFWVKKYLINILKDLHWNVRNCTWILVNKTMEV